MRQATVVVIVGFLGIVIGLGLGQVTHADAGNSDPNTAILKRIERKLGAGYINESVLGLLSDIKSNTWGTCEALNGPGCQLLTRPQLSPKQRKPQRP